MCTRYKFLVYLDTITYVSTFRDLIVHVVHVVKSRGEPDCPYGVLILSCVRMY